jgi:hypothetical protein
MLHAYSTATSSREQILSMFEGAGSDLSTKAFPVFWRAITTRNSVKLNIQNHFGHLPSGPVLSQFLRESSSLQVLELHGVHFKEEHCYALATVKRTDLASILFLCKAVSRG